MLTVQLHLFYGKANYQLQYIDYGDNVWTAPCLLTKERADKFCEDHSVTKVKLRSANSEPLIAGKPHIEEIELDLK